MNAKHREKAFEDELVDHLTAHGWLLGDAARYDRALALYPDDLTGWLQDTQPKEWAKVAAASATPERDVLARVAKLLDTEGALALLRHGFKYTGAGTASFQLCQFKPSQGLNPDILSSYNAVRCRVVRQVRYSLHNENCIDLVLFVNGIPVATLELKTDFTQTVREAIRQYQTDRSPRDPITKKEEPLLAFKRRALVHFAVSTDEVYMTTALRGPGTVFLPFNLGTGGGGADGGAGNPANPTGYRTSYLWERVLQRDAWLDILGRFVHLAKEKKAQPDGGKAAPESLIFPRFHQWDAVTKLVAAARDEGPGQRYLIQHSAGSGKSNSIAWLAHQLASLHDGADRKVFDSIIVVTDRTVLDEQLQETIDQFEHKKGLVCRVTREGVKSAQLVEALKESRPIIIVTLQTFPFVLEAIRAEMSLKSRRFAVIADEAHSSQTGASAAMLKQVLTAEQIEEGEEVSAEDVLVASMAARKQPKTISYFAFTATPKAKTLELFGRVGSSGLPEPFHVYSMQQAIEEGFILDVLRNYTPFHLAYRLAHNGRELDDATIDETEGMKALARWVRLHPYNIEQKAATMVEHFRAVVMPLLEGKAKAMVVTSSRKEAVRFKLAIDHAIRAQGYPIGTLVAFSGEVSDPDSGPDKFSEANMNPALRGRDLREAFKSDEFKLLVVANKFQTGFDQPLLAAMYVDKKLAGVAAVQTLSRLNRTATGKDQTYVLDFVNTAEEMRVAFAPYYRVAALESTSDPNLLHDLQRKLDDGQIYTPSEVDAFARAYFDPKGRQSQLQAHVAPAVDRFRMRWRAASEASDRAAIDTLRTFRKDLGSFIRAYEFLSQIVDYGDTDLEKRNVFFKHLLPWLKEESAGEQIDLSGVALTHYRLQDLGRREIRLRETKTDEYRLVPLTEVGTRAGHDPEKARLSELIERLNELFVGDNLTDVDRVALANHVRDKMLENEALAQQAATNTKDQFALGDFQQVFVETLIGAMDNYQTMAAQVLTDEQVKKGFAALMLDMVYQQFAERRPA